MSKMEKLNKGLIKITFFDKPFKCKEPITTIKKVYKRVLTTCNCVVSNNVIDFTPHVDRDHNLELEVSV